MNHQTFSHLVFDAVKDYVGKSFIPRSLVPANNDQGSGKPRAKPFDIALTLPRSSILLLELKIIPWPATRVTFQPLQLESLVELSGLGVPVHFCYPLAVDLDSDPADPTQGRSGLSIRENSKVSPPPVFVDNSKHVRLEHHEHITLQAHLGILTGDNAIPNAKNIFICLRERLCGMFELLCTSALVVLYDIDNQTITTLNKDEFTAVFAELKNIVGRTFSPEQLQKAELEDIAGAVEHARAMDVVRRLKAVCEEPDVQKHSDPEM